MSTVELEPAEAKADQREPFVTGLWTKEINVRDFIQANYTPYYDDESFLANPTERTLGV